MPLLKEVLTRQLLVDSPPPLPPSIKPPTTPLTLTTTQSSPVIKILTYRSSLLAIPSTSFTQPWWQQWEGIKSCSQPTSSGKSQQLQQHFIYFLFFLDVTVNGQEFTHPLNGSIQNPAYRLMNVNSLAITVDIALFEELFLNDANVWNNRRVDWQLAVQGWLCTLSTVYS